MMGAARSRIRQALAVAVLLAAVCPVVHAQDRPEEDRPFTALVLAGGGARGGAHVGVLKVLEEQRVPVDFVVGTSMGSIVGGLYASGMSPEEMAEAFEAVDWVAAFHDQPDRKYVSYRRKEDDRLALFPIEIGLGPGGFKFKKGLVAGQKINFILEALTLHTSGIRDFDNLQLPFRAVAADLSTGDRVVIDHGDLSDGMRASMAIPGVFTPVEWEGLLLVDGGIVDNLPIDVALEMGAERIIAIDVGTHPKEMDEAKSLFAVASQTLSVLNKRNVKESRALIREQDTLLIPDIPIKTGDFEEIMKAVDAGESAARGILDEWRQYSVSEEEYQRFLAKQRRPANWLDPDITIDAIEVRGVDKVDPKLMKKRMDTRVGEQLDLRRLMTDLRKLQQIGEFEMVSFDIQKDDDGRTTLNVDAQEKSWGPNYLRVGINIESDFEGRSDFAAIANYRMASLNKFGAEWKTDVSVGEPALFDTEFFQPLHRAGYWFVAPTFRWNRDERIRFLANRDKEVIDVRHWAAGFDLGLLLRNWGEIRVGAESGRAKASAETTSVFPSTDLDTGGWRTSATMDQLDKAFFPRAGTLLEVEGYFSRDSLGADDEYDKLAGRALWIGSKGNNTVGLAATGGTDLGSDIPFYNEFQLGGFGRLSGLERGKVAGDVFVLLSTTYYYRLGKGTFGNFYVGGIFQGGEAWQNTDSVDLGELRPSGTVYAGLDTALSPIYVGYGLAEGGNSQYYLFVGRIF
jgi:NTE family protein